MDNMKMKLITTNHHIVEKIFNFCSNSALLCLRLVCKQWGYEASRILMRRISICFRSLDDIEEFLQIPRPLSPGFTNFIIDINNGPQSQCPPPLRRFSLPELEVPPEIVDLLECYRDEMTELKFWYQPQLHEEQEQEQEENENNVAGSEAETFEVMTTLSSLKSLQLVSNYVHTSQPTQNGRILHRMPRYLSKMATPNLRSLSVQHLHDTECVQPFIINIIKSCRNPLEYLKIPAKSFNSLAQHSMITPSDFANLWELDLLGIFHGYSSATNETVDLIIKNFGKKLGKLGIEFSFRLGQDRIRDLLATLSESLVELRCTIQDRNFLARQIVQVEWRFPEMKRLRCLQMRWSNPGLIYYLQGLSSLEELMLDTVWTRKVPGNIFPNGVVPIDNPNDNPPYPYQYQNVTCLKLTDVISVLQVQVFAKYFPNLQTLGCSFDSNESLRTVYETMKNLHTLIIERKSNVTEAAGVCGFDDDQLPEHFSQSDRNLVRKYPYIGDLKDLENLELCQLGITWCSIFLGVMDIPGLRSLVIQTKAFRASSNESDRDQKSSQNQQNSYLSLPLISLVALKLKQLRHLTLWLRHTSERPSSQETDLIKREMHFLNELNVVNHSLCGI